MKINCGFKLSTLLGLILCLGLSTGLSADVIDVPGDYATIQGAIDAAVTGDLIQVAAGTYQEQLRIDSKDIDLAGAGIGTTVVEAPDPVDRTTFNVVKWTGAAEDIDAIIGVTNANVDITGFTVDGRETGPDHYYGIYYFDSSGTVDFCRIVDILYAASPGAQKVASLVATHGEIGSFAVDFSNNQIPNFQKGGILIMGPDGTFTVEYNAIVNAPSEYNAGNGIQLSYGASGSTAYNDVQGVGYLGEDWAATGILLFESGDIDMTGDIVDNCQSGVNYSDWGWVYNHPVPVNLSFTDLDLHDNGWALTAQLSRDNSDVNFTATGCQIYDNTGDGIDIFGTDVDPWGGSYYLGWDNGDLVVDISDCSITGTTGWDGIWTDDSSGNANNVSFTVTNCSFQNNAEAAIWNNFTQTIDAEGCYWGDTSAPSQIRSDDGQKLKPAFADPFGFEMPETPAQYASAGSGRASDSYYGNVDYSPWAMLSLGTLPMDWGTDDSIQDAVDMASSGDAIYVSAGSYAEQVDVNKDLSITGAGAGTTTVACPGAMTSFFNTGTNDNYPVLYAHDADVDFSALTVDGAGLGNANYRFIGVAFYNAGGSLSDAEVLNIIDTPFSGAQHGVGVYSYNSTGGPYDIAMSNVLVDDFQKTGVALSGDGLTVDLDNVTTVGQGATAVTAQNGIQISYGASGTIDTASISDVAYTGGSWTATGLLAYAAGILDATDVDIDGCQTSVYYIDSDGSFNGGSVTNPLGDALYAYVSPPILNMGGPNLMAHPFGEGDDGGGGRSTMMFSMDGSSFTGSDLVDSWGPTAWAEGDLQFDMDNCDVSHWDFGVAIYEDGGTASGMARGNDFHDNLSYGVWSNSVSPYDARENYWNDPTGPYHPTANPGGLGDVVSDNVLFEPWTGMADLAVLPASNGPINCSQSVILNFRYTPGDMTPALRGYELTVACSGELSFDDGDVTDLGALSDIGMQSFYVVDNGDGSYTVSAALLGPTSGLLVEDDLFSVKFHGNADGSGDAQITSYKLRDLNNGDFFATTTDAEVLVDCVGPDDPTLFAEPDFTIGTENTLDWSDESASGAALYYIERAQDAGFTVDVQNSGWVAPLTHTFTGLSDDTEYFYRVKDKDALDNESAWSNVESSTQDDNLPVSEAGPLDAYQTSLTFDVPYVASDLTSGVDYVELYYQLNGGAWFPLGGTYSTSPISFTAAGDGSYCFFTVATDIVGNVELNPPSGDVCTIVDTTAPTGTFVVNNDDAYTTTVSVTLNNGITDTNGPIMMQFSNDGSTWSGWVAYAATYPWTLDPPDGSKTVYAQFRDDAGLIYSPSDDIILDTAPPGAADDLSGLAGHEKGILSWTDPGDADLAGVEVWRGPWHDGSNVSVYPEYDDIVGNTIPTRPATRAAADASVEWTLAGTALPGDEAFTDLFVPRGIYYYELFAQDSAGNYGPPLAENIRVMNYWLGDVRPVGYDGYLDVADITALGTAFGTGDGEGAYENEIDVGPTNDWSRLGFPLTDNLVDFEDLMIFAMNYSVVAPRPVIEGAVDYAMLSWYQIDETTWALGLLKPCSDLKALLLRAELPEGIEISIEMSALLQHQGGVPVFLRNVDHKGLDISMAAMGIDAVVQGEGELFRVKLNTPCDLSNVSLDARASNNRPLDFELEATEIPILPTSYAMAKNYPNPFNPKTTIRFDLPEAQHVKLMVFDTTGRRIASLIDDTMQAGFHSIMWNGRDDRGNQLASGVYFYRIDAGPLNQTERMVLLK
jgi:hypothetical protein